MNSIDHFIQQTHEHLATEPGLHPPSQPDSIETRAEAVALPAGPAPRLLGTDNAGPDISQFTLCYHCRKPIEFLRGKAFTGWSHCGGDLLCEGKLGCQAAPERKRVRPPKDYMSIDDCREVAVVHFERVHPGFAERYGDGENLKRFILDCAANVGWECAAKATRRARGISE
jgi:hypothetical protein